MNKFYLNATHSQIKRYGSDESYLLTPLNDLKVTESTIEDITAVCSEPLVYNGLLKELFPYGYTRDNAIGFVKHGKAGWDKNEHFVFLILTKDHRVVGCLSIKNNDLEAGEIGYWVSSKHNGLATNAVSNLCKMAKKIGFQRLFAQTKASNERSIRVLERNGFTRDDSFKRDQPCDQAYVRLL